MTDWTEWSECSHRCGQRAKLCATCGPYWCLDLGHFFPTLSRRLKQTCEPRLGKAWRPPNTYCTLLHIAAPRVTQKQCQYVKEIERGCWMPLDAPGFYWILLGMYWECTGNVLGMYWECTGNVLGMYWCHLTILTERHLWRNDKASWFILHWGLGWWIEQEKLRRVEIARLSESIVR